MKTIITIETSMDQLDVIIEKVANIKERHLNDVQEVLIEVYDKHPKFS